VEGLQELLQVEGLPVPPQVALLALLQMPTWADRHRAAAAELQVLPNVGHQQEVEDHLVLQGHLVLPLQAEGLQKAAAADPWVPELVSGSQVQQLVPSLLEQKLVEGLQEQRLVRDQVQLVPKSLELVLGMAP